MKKAIITFVMMLFVFVMPTSADAQVKIIVDGKELVTDVAPVIENGRTLVPIRAIMDTLEGGMDVEWDESTRTVSLLQGDYALELKPDQAFAVPSFFYSEATGYVAEEPIKLDVPARIINSRLMVPLRFVLEEFHFGVYYDNGTVYIASSSSTLPEGSFNYEGYFAEIASILKQISDYDTKYNSFIRGITETNRFVDATLLSQADSELTIIDNYATSFTATKYGSLPYELETFNSWIEQYFDEYVTSNGTYLDIANNNLLDEDDMLDAGFRMAGSAGSRAIMNKQYAIEELQKVAPQYNYIFK